MISYLLPTRDRPERLRRTLAALGELDAEAHASFGGAEIIVVDNASDPPASAPERLGNGFPVRMLHRSQNEGAAARNVGAHFAVSSRSDSGGKRLDWIIMLDDDSHPLDSGHIDALLEAPPDVAAVGAEIFLPDGQRESGGLPEVFIGCGVAIRASAFLEAGGYDPSFDYYAEEYDLAARFILRGWRIIHDRRFRVRHEKIAAGRDMNRIVHRLVRNNAWVARRYAPPGWCEAEIFETIARYGRIAVKEHAARGYAQGVSELLAAPAAQPSRTMTTEQFDRFTGLAHVRRTLAAHGPGLRARDAAIVDSGKNKWAVRQVLSELGVRLVADETRAHHLVIGTLSPGPMLDAFDHRIAIGQPVICPWDLGGVEAAATA